MESVTICIKTLAEYQDCIALREKKITMVCNIFHIFASNNNE